MSSSLTPKARSGTALLVAAVLATGGALGSPASAAVEQPPAAAASDVTVVARLVEPDGTPTFVEVEGGSVADRRRAAASLPGSIGSTLDAPVWLAGGTDPYRSKQWALDTLRVDALPAVDTGTQVVAVIDTGVLATHEDFAPGQVLCSRGADFTGDGKSTNGCIDPHGHGSHVAGIVAGVKGNGVGIAGIAPGTAILPVRSLGADGSGTAQAVARGIVHAVDSGATVVNLSVAGPYSAVYNDAVAYAVSRGVTVVAAAGNNRTTGNAASWPASSPGAVSVAATDSSNVSASFSHTGPDVDIAAPGRGIYSLGSTNSAYVLMSGTSMAAPYVAGAAALHRASNPGAIEPQVTATLTATAEDLEIAGRDDATGAGLVDVYELVAGGGQDRTATMITGGSPLTAARGRTVQSLLTLSTSTGQPLAGHRVTVAITLPRLRTTRTLTTDAQGRFPVSVVGGRTPGAGAVTVTYAGTTTTAGSSTTTSVEVTGGSTRTGRTP